MTRLHRPLRVLSLVVLCLAVSIARAERIQALVVGVTDGDTVTVLTPEKKRMKVRLAAIDAPEKGQPFGKAAKQALSDLVFRRDVTVDGDKLDRYGRLVAKIEHEGRDVNLELARMGLAWWYRKYANEQSAGDRLEYAAAEQRAREAALGLWADDSPIAPWEWRRR